MGDHRASPREGNEQSGALRGCPMRGPLPPDLLVPQLHRSQSGISALAEIEPAFSGVPVLMVSAYLDDVRNVAEALGARCFVKSDFLEHAADLLAEFTGIAPVSKTELV